MRGRRNEQYWGCEDRMTADEFVAGRVRTAADAAQPRAPGPIQPTDAANRAALHWRVCNWRSTDALS